MKMIVIEEAKFDKLFDDLREKLEFEKFRHKTPDAVHYPPDSMHRAFNYHVCKFRDELKNA